MLPRLTFTKTRSIVPLEMGKQVCQQTKKVSRHSKKPGTKFFSNMQMKVLKIKEN
jgi:hypothetical protein